MVNAAAFRRALPPDATIGHWRGPDGWGLRRFDWSAEGSVGGARGHILFGGGRGDAFEKYLETFAHWHGRGWSVTSLDWRGQGGSGRGSPAGDVGHVESFDRFVDDLAAFWRDWRAQAPGPAVLVGHSMGGHLALRTAVEGRIDPDALVLVAPMLGLRTPLGARWGGRLAQLVAALGDPTRAAWRGNERPGTLLSRQAMLTHDAGRYADERWWHEAVPETRLGPPSWRWLTQAFASSAALLADPRLDTFTIPVLMLVADADRLVDPAAALAVAARLPNVALHRFGPESAHEILREADPVRDRALAAIDGFLATATTR